MRYAIFDDRFNDNFFPLTLNRSTGDLRVGILKLRQRIAAFLEIEDAALIIPEKLADIYKERHPEKMINCLKKSDTVLINSRLKITDDWVRKIKSLPQNACYVAGDLLLAVRCQADEQEISTESLETLTENLKKIDTEPDNCWKYSWELILQNADYIKRDFAEFFYERDNYFETEPGVTILNPYNVWIGEGTEFMPGVVIDASAGPVVIDENVRILPNAVIIGPAYIGKSSLIKAGARIYEGTSIGPVCKIGGEVESTIFQGYSNKQHDGFLGHAYLGEWVNLGADTNNSDLKNNYKPVKTYFYPVNDKIDTGYQFLGAVIADHTKTGINCSLNTGTVIGLGCNLYGHELISGFIPSFSWGTGSQIVTYKLASFLQTSGIVKQRRDLKLSAAEKKLFTDIHDKETSIDD